MSIETSDPDTQLRLPGAAVDEGHMKQAVEHDLQRAFPSVPTEQVETLVECLWSHFDAAPVRDFVPLLVAKQAREELLDHLGPHAEP